MKSLELFLCCLLLHLSSQQNAVRRLGKFQEVFAWKQLTYNINGNVLLQDRFGEDNIDDEVVRTRRQADRVIFDNQEEPERNWSNRGFNNQISNRPFPRPPQTNQWNNRPLATNRPTTSSTTTARPSDDPNSFFIQYNNVPMGVEKVGNKVFVTVPRRRYGIPSTLNYIDLKRDRNQRSPALRPYPNLRQARTLTSVYRTRADECGRLWMVDTGLMELPNNPQQIQPPAIVVFDLNTNRQILRYQLKSSDLPANNTPTGLASITVDIVNGNCADAHAYIPDLTTYGLIVFSLRGGDSWRLSHNYFNFNPTAGNLDNAGLRFQWSDGIFSITLTGQTTDGCKTAYFHPLISTQEFAVSTCLLKNRTASSDSNYWSRYALSGERGENSQSTMHSFHNSSRVIFYADIGRNAISCWNTGEQLVSSNVAVLAQDNQRLNYPSDLHVTDDEVWVMANSLPRFGYARLDTNEYNFYVYKGRVPELIAGTVCSGSNNFNNNNNLYFN